MNAVDVKPFLINGESPCIRQWDNVIIRPSYDKDNPQQAIFYKGVQLQRLSEKGYPKENEMDSKRQSELTGNSKTGAEMTSDLFKDKAWFDSQYWQEKKSVPEIAKLCGRHKSTVYKWIWANKWAMRHGNQFGTKVSKETAEKIRKAQLGEKNHAWRGGKTKASGYVLVKAPTHPYRDKCNYVKEHRLVVEKSMGRFLNPWELVHHKNGKRDDNRIENLEIKYRAEHHRKHLHCPHCGGQVY